MSVARRLPVGADLVTGGAHVRVWAPGHGRVDVVLDGEPDRSVTLEQEADGEHHAGLIEGAAAGTRYFLSVDGSRPLPDPASRFQPEGPHGPSEVIDPATFRWTDDAWRGPTLPPTCIYELHVGAFTAEGTYDAARRHLGHLADLGIDIIEILPLAEFPGDFGWGYDGVDLYAPSRLYGRPDDLRRFVDEAHSLGIGVILDVVYNHLGPDGCYVSDFSDTFFSRRYGSDWGQTPNFDEEGSEGVREFVIGNARYWIEEFHFDGLRIDATQQIFDSSAEHVIAAVCRTAREAAGGRSTYVIAENEPQETRLVRPTDTGGFGLDALWNDDIHHTAMVALTGRNEAYYTDYRGAPQEFVSAAKWGYLYQGQRYTWQRDRRGTPGLDLPPSAYVAYMQNHDQVANSLAGDRVSQLASPGRLRALTAYLLLSPATPMLFMGQEWAASSPFLFFADHQGDLAAMVRDGRRDFLAQFPSIAIPDVADLIPDPASPDTFRRSRLDHEERSEPRHAAWLALHSDLLALRRSAPAFAEPRSGGVDGAVLGEAAFVLRFFGRDDRGASAEERLLIVNLGPQLDLRPAPEPLLAPPLGTSWRLAFTSEDPRYGGVGSPEPETAEGWTIAAESAVVLRPVPRGAAE